MEKCLYCVLVKTTSFVFVVIDILRRRKWAGTLSRKSPSIFPSFGLIKNNHQPSTGAPLYPLYLYLWLPEDQLTSRVQVAGGAGEGLVFGEVGKIILK